MIRELCKGLFTSAATCVILTAGIVQAAPAKLPAPTQAKPSNSAEVPEYEGEVNAVSGGNIFPLERQNAEMKFKVNALGFGGAKSLSKVKGARSPVRFTSGQAVYFVIKTSEYDQSNPADTWQMNPLEIKGKNRELTTMSVAGFGSRDRRMESAIPLRFKRIGKNVFQFTTAQALTPGEYAISMSGMGTTMALFGID